MGANPTLLERESAIPCSTMTQLPFGLAGRSHHALSCTLSLATTSTSAAFGGGAPTCLGTCSVAAQKAAPTPTKHRAPLRLTATVMLTFLNQIKPSSCTVVNLRYRFQF